MIFFFVQQSFSFDTKTRQLTLGFTILSVLDILYCIFAHFSSFLQFLQFFSPFSRYFVILSFSCAVFNLKLYLKLLSKLEIQIAFSFITSHLLVNSNRWALKPIELLPFMRPRTQKSFKFLTLEQKFIKNKLSVSSHTCFLSNTFCPQPLKIQ